MIDLIKPTICIYHGGCDDGFGAAWVVWKKWGHDLAYFPGVYGDPPPNVEGHNVLMVDFSYKRPVIEDMARQARSLTILDHHKTAEAELAGIEEWARRHWRTVRVTFNLQHSGVRLAWDALFPSEDRPSIVEFIEDQDLWRFDYGDNTRFFTAALRSYPQDFEVWSQIASDPIQLIGDGEGIRRAHERNIGRFLKEHYFVMMAGHRVPVVNVPYHYASDVAAALLDRHPDAPFAMAWFMRGDGMIQYSLRSQDHRVDVSEVAKTFGGGGHRNAAGFETRQFAWDEASR